MIKSLKKVNASRVAELHLMGMPGDFLPSFGLRFLEQLHQGMITSSQAIALGFFSDNILQGFVIGSMNTKYLMRDVFKKKGFNLLPEVFLKVIVRPITTTKKIFQTLTYGKDSLISSELMIIAIDKDARMGGIGTKLVKALQREFRKKSVKQFIVSTLENNKGAQAFYKKIGGKRIGTFQQYGHTWISYEFFC